MIKNKNVFAAIAGRANTGKSTLMNLLVGDKVAIVSDKPQTTRTIIHGIITRENTQYIFVDTPGFHRANNKLSEHMVKNARAGVAGADVVLFMHDCTKKITPLTGVIDELDIPVILLLNKVDLIKEKTKLLTLIEEYSKLYNFTDIIPISAKTGENTGKILPAIEKYAAGTENGEYYFPDDITTDQAEKVWLAELIREKLLQCMYEEIPHGIAVEVESMEENRTNRGKAIIDISAVIICEKNSHKGMLIGKQGVNLKRIGTQSRHEMEEYFKCKVNMKLWVKVKEDWRNKEGFITGLGLSSQ